MRNYYLSVINYAIYGLFYALLLVSIHFFKTVFDEMTLQSFFETTIAVIISSTITGVFLGTIAYIVRVNITSGNSKKSNAFEKKRGISLSLLASIALVIISAQYVLVLCVKRHFFLDMITATALVLLLLSVLLLCMHTRKKKE